MVGHTWPRLPLCIKFGKATVHKDASLLKTSYDYFSIHHEQTRRKSKTRLYICTNETLEREGGGGWRGLNGGVEARSNINTIILFHSSTGCLKICESRRNNKDFELKYVIFIDVVCNL